jgi:hypothetical protein
MPDLSDLIAESHQHVSAGFLETLIQARREELFTGLMRLSDSTGDHHVQSFLEGIQQKLYLCSGETVQVIPRQKWQEALGRDHTGLGFLPVPVEAMRFVRILYETPVSRVESLLLSSEQLLQTARSWADESRPGIAHVQGNQVDRYYLIAGLTTPVVEELSILDGEVRLSLNNSSFASMLPKQEYQVRRYVSVRDHEAWREYELRHVFNPYMRMLFSRFSEMAGRVLTERLCERLTVWAQGGGWNVALSSNGVVNRQYFDNLESAVGLYEELLDRFQQEAGLAIGSRMADGILQEILVKLDAGRRELLTKNLFGRQGANSASWR